MKYVGYAIPVLASSILLNAPSAVAETSDEDELALVYGDKATISIATGSQQALRRAPAVATVITAEDIVAMGATDLDEVLETVPGMHVARSANLYNPLYVIRGIYSQFNPQTLVLQNGIPMTAIFIGNRGIWGGYPVEHISRIEIIRGPGSALYGADAYAGVINIITKTAADTPDTQFGLRAGSFNTGSAWLQHGGKMGPVDVAAYVRIGKTDGFKQTIAADAQTRTDGFFRTRASLAPGNTNVGYDAIDGNFDLGFEKWRLRAGYKLRDNVGTGAGIASALDPVGKEKSERITTDLSWTDPQLSRDWGLGFTGSYLHYAQLIPTYLQLLGPGTTLPTGTFPNGMVGAPETWERQLRLSAFATYAGFTNHNLRLGLGHDDLNLYKTAEYRNFTYSPNGTPIPLPGGAPVLDFSDTAPFIKPQRRTVDYVYAQDEWNFTKDLTLTTGVRHDRYSDFGGTTNPRVALVWDATLDVTAKLLAGRAFRAPAFNEVYGITNPVALGNPNLRPETINTVEAAIAWRVRADMEANLSLFRFDMKDLIRNVAGTYANTGAQNGRGAELEVVWDLSRSLRVSGNYAWQQSIDEATQQDAGYAPHHHIYARADWRASGGWMTSTQINWVADRNRPPGDVRPKIADYATLDITVRTSSRKRQWELSGGVRNLLNADVREPSVAPGTAIPYDLPMAPRVLYAQATYRL